MYRGWWKYNWTFFSVYMMTVNDFIKSQNSIQCLTNFEEIIVIFGVRWNEPFEMWKRAVWKYWTVWTKNTIKLCTLNVEGKSSQLRAKMTHYKTWFVQFSVIFFRFAEWNTPDKLWAEAIFGGGERSNSKFFGFSALSATRRRRWRRSWRSMLPRWRNSSSSGSGGRVGKKCRSCRCDRANFSPSLPCKFVVQLWILFLCLWIVLK